METGLHERDRAGVQDFVLLENYTSEVAFIENLKKRFQENLIYVRNVGNSKKHLLFLFLLTLTLSLSRYASAPRLLLDELLELCKPSLHTPSLITILISLLSPCRPTLARCSSP